MTAQLYRIGVAVDRVTGVTTQAVFEDFGDGLMYCVCTRFRPSRVVLASEECTLDAPIDGEDRGNRED